MNDDDCGHVSQFAANEENYVWEFARFFVGMLERVQRMADQKA